MTRRIAKNRRTRVGLALADLYSGAGQALWPSVADRAAEEDIDFFCFPGGRIGQKEGYESSRNTVFDLAAGAGLEGMLVWPSSMSGAAPESVVRDLVDRFAGKPLVALSSGLSGLPVVAIDYYGGMRKAVLHAAECHGIRRIAFLRGPELHEGARERYRAYLETLSEAGLDADPRLVSSPWFWDEGTEAVLELLDGRSLVPGRDFGGLLASSDLMALFAIKALQSRGYAIPGDLAVIGMNGSIESRISTPPITTANGPFARLGAAGFDILAGTLAGRKMPGRILLESDLVVRESCGCPPERRTAEPATEGRTAYDIWEDGRRDIALRTLGRDLLMSLNHASMSARLLAGLPALGVRSAYVCRFDDSRDRARLVAGFRDGEDLCDRARSFPSSLLAPPECLPDRRLAYVVEPLFFHENPIGYALFEIGPKTGAFYESLRDAVSGALRSIGLVADIESARERAERADSIKTHLLSNVSHELRAPVTTILKGAERIAATMTDPTGAERARTVPAKTTARTAAGRTKEKAGRDSSREDLDRIIRSARQQLRLVNDLLDLSRAEMDELDIARAPLEPAALLAEIFSDYAADAGQGVRWTHSIPERLPLVMADASRIRQIIGNLLDNARKFTLSGTITMTAKVEPPWLAVSVTDTGPGIPARRLPKIFEPFVSAGRAGVAGATGAGLGLGIARHLALLHFGTLEVASEEGSGSTFTLKLPLPDQEGRKALPRPAVDGGRDIVALIASAVAGADTIAGADTLGDNGCAEGRGGDSRRGDPHCGDERFPGGGRGKSDPRGGLQATAARLGIDPEKIYRITLKDAEDGLLESLDPVAVAWDLTCEPGPEEWSLFRKIRQSAALATKPFIVYPPPPDTVKGAIRSAAAAFVGKDADGDALARFAGLLLGGNSGDPVLVADDDPEARADACRLVAAALPGREILAARDGAEAWKFMSGRSIALAVLDIVMPPPDGFALLERMRADPRLAGVPVLLLTDKTISAEDIARVDSHPRLSVRNKGILTADEDSEDVSRLVSGRDRLPAATGAIVKRTVAFLNRNYPRTVTRWKMAQAAGVSEDYVSRLFRKEMGLTPWEYLARLRITRAKDLLVAGTESVAAIAARVGIDDQAYFSRVFRKITGTSPQSFREAGRRR